MAVIITILLVVFLAGWWLFEYRKHNRRLKSIPIRVHVNGSRGKSTVTRLIGAALRESGIRTVTKTTGTYARFIFPDGHEEPIIRIGPANIQEQRRVVKKASELGIDALVTECMAIDPEFQWVLQEKYIKGNIGVLTNVRHDHLDVMGPTIMDAAKAMASVMPSKKLIQKEREFRKDGKYPLEAICFVAETDPAILDELQSVADKVGCKLVTIVPEDISDEEIAKFSYIEYKENVALALAVAIYLGIDRETALKGMWKCTPDPGVLKLWEIEHEGCHIRFANAFAANDPDSTMKIWKLFQTRLGKDEQVFVIANSRSDRIQRAEQLGGLMAQIPAHGYILVGGLLPAIADNMRRIGIPDEKIHFIHDGDPIKIVRTINEKSSNKAFVLGIGNIGGPGHKIADFFEEHATSYENHKSQIHKTQ